MSRLSAIIVGTTIALVQPTIAWAQDVYDIAQEITVYIDGCSSGSGVIFNKKGNTYYVLTANHVVDENQNFCRVQTPDGKKHRPEPSLIQPIEGLDLAVVQFVSNNRYRVGKLGDSALATIGKTVYVAGAPPSSQVIDERTLRVTEGKIIGRVSEDRGRKGYTLIYDNTTRKGMSGGPVLNEVGEIIGIHGRGDQEDGSKENYGIPIEKFQDPRGSRFWPIPSPPDDVDESGKVGEGLSLPLILLGGLAILGGGASLGYLFGSRTQSKNKTKVSYSPPPKVNSTPESSSRVVREREPEPKVAPNPVTVSRSEPYSQVKEPIIEHEEKLSSTSEITTSRSEPSRRNEPTILSEQHSEVTAQPEERVPARYHKLRDLLAAGEWKEADLETERVMRQVAKQEEEIYLRVEDIENFPCEDLRTIDKLWVKYSNGRFGFSVQKRIWLEEKGKVDDYVNDYEIQCRLADRVGWRFGEKRYYDLTTAPTGHLPSWVVQKAGVLTQRSSTSWARDNGQFYYEFIEDIRAKVLFSRAQMCKL